MKIIDKILIGLCALFIIKLCIFQFFYFLGRLIFHWKTNTDLLLKITKCDTDHEMEHAFSAECKQARLDYNWFTINASIDLSRNLRSCIDVDCSEVFKDVLNSIAGVVLVIVLLLLFYLHLTTRQNRRRSQELWGNHSSQQWDAIEPASPAIIELQDWPPSGGGSLRQRQIAY